MPLVATLAIFLALDVISFKFNLSLTPRLAPVSVLQIILPVSFVSRSLAVDERAVAVGHSVLPLALVSVAICLSHATLAGHLVVLELSFVLRSVRPSQHAKPFFY